MARWVLARTALLSALFVGGPCRADDTRIFVSNEYFTFGSPNYCTVAIELVDFDRDGDLDALMVNGRHWARQDLVFANNGNGRFLEAIELGGLATGYAPAVTDLDADGIPDIVVARDRVPSRRFMGRGDGRFDAGHTVGRAGATRAVAAGDLDDDGIPDLVFSERGGTNFVVFGPSFGNLVEFGAAEQTVRLKLADLDHDGDLDAVFANLGAEGNVIHLNDGSGGLRESRRLDPSHSMAVDVDTGDLNGDGLTDLAFAMLGANVIFLNDPEDAFTRTFAFGDAAERSYGIAVGDLDNDGDADIAVANDGAPNAIYINEGGRFRRSVLPEDTQARSYGVSIGDLNGDGFADVVFANSGAMSRIYLNATPATAAALLAR